MEEKEIARNKQQTIGFFLVILATVALSTEAIAAKFAYSNGAGTLTILAPRYLIAAICFSCSLLWKPVACKLTLKDHLNLLLLNLGCQATAVLALFAAFHYITAAMAILLLYIYPLLVSILAHFFLGERLSKKKILALVLTMIGCVVILGGPQEQLAVKGIIFAVFSAAAYAVFLTGSTRLLSRVPVTLFNTYVTLELAVFFTILALAKNQLTWQATPLTWGAIIFLGLVCTVAAMAFFFRGVKCIGASKAAIVATLEPAFTALWGYLFLAETLTIQQALGGILIILGVFLNRKV